MVERLERDTWVDNVWVCRIAAAAFVLFLFGSAVWGG